MGRQMAWNISVECDGAVSQAHNQIGNTALRVIRPRSLGAHKSKLSQMGSQGEITDGPDIDSQRQA